VTRIIIAHHREAIAADRVLRLESGRVLGTEAADLSLLAAAAKLLQLKLVYALPDISVETPAPHIVQYQAA